MSRAHRPSSLYGSTTSSYQSATLQSRINQKRVELDNLRQLRDLSAQLAAHMSQLEEKLSTLKDGTEAVAEVMRNWNSVLGVLNMVGQSAAKLPDANSELELPGTLVRVPIGTSRHINAEEEGAEGTE